MDFNANLEIIGETGAPSMYMKIQYCGGWGYRPHVNTFKAKLDELLPGNKIQYQLACDPTTTGNFECTVFDNAALQGDGNLIWSKQAKGNFPF